MKTIEVSDEDYETLMGLSKELQMQPNHGQAFPYFWEPRSERLVVNMNDEGEVEKLFLDGEEIDLQERFENDDTTRKDFLEANKYNPDITFEELSQRQQDEFSEFLVHMCDVVRRTYDWEEQAEHNPSLFLSDVQGFVEHNKHHLGRNPSTYSRTVWRMPKMEKLIRAIYRINRESGTLVNHEASIAIAEVGE